MYCTATDKLGTVAWEKISVYFRDSTVLSYKDPWMIVRNTWVAHEFPPSNLVIVFVICDSGADPGFVQEGVHSSLALLQHQ